MTASESEDSSRLARAASLIGENNAVGFEIVGSPDGHLSRRENGVAFAFAFRFRDRPFAAKAVTEGDILNLSLSAEFGVLPFSQEDRGRRAEILAFLPQLRQGGLNWEISRTQVVRVGAALRLEGVTAPREILAAVIEHLLMFRPLLDAMAELAYIPAQPTPRGHRLAAS